ncbi:transglycosylase domain-containing protein [Aquibacillus sediminis]|uniref:transglycosylase domain-containing protein n=1 Tax=Aquibacillus sediminis TaxID=2574734 RepID=UPI001FECE366|nr:transglycosylase domain-containing protein [Aquibacillus sediminis]
MVQTIKKMLLKIKNRRLRWLVAAGFGLSFALIVFIVGFFTYVYSLGPPPLTSEQNTVYYSSSGQVIGEEHGPENRYWKHLEDIDSDIIQSTLHTEDRRFYEHNGFDFKRIIAAALKDLKSFSMNEGASTITQQYARNMYLSHEKTWTRKLKEAFYTLRLELFYSKDAILEGYLNTIYYGHGAYGVEAASRYFFNKSANDLSLAEATMLAGIPKGPSYYSPFHNFDNAKRRQLQILATLKAKNYISEQQQKDAAQTELAFTENHERTKISIAPYFQDMVLRELRSVLDQDIEKIKSGGYQVYTTLNVENQKQLEQTVTERLPNESEIQVGALAMNPKTGAVTSLIGGKDYQSSQFNRAIQAKRMPGSAFKPFLYYAALNHGYTPTTALLSKPTNFELADGTVYQPSNYNGYYAEKPVTLAQALAVSDNIYAVKTNLYLTPEKLVETAEQFGINSELQATPSLALGTGSVSVDEMVTGYSMLANGGYSIQPYTIEKVTDAKGNVLYERQETTSEPILDPKTSFILTHLMTGMFDRSLNGYMQVTGTAIADQLTRPYAGKSGTTSTDSWMIGYSPNLTTGVWIGYDENKRLEKAADHRYAKQIWADFMESAHEGKPMETFEVPDGVVGAYVDPTSGELATPYCEDDRLMYFVEGTEPTSYCTAHNYDEQNDQHDEELEEQDDEQEEEPSRLKKMLDWLPFVD